ncbi:Alpha/Beta hydrolase protein [Podospora australis]|uniref:Alpha/Beta hydrolase protein n=1 Tax=Podospora australis TaxID=1536484 RepID=A0AAN7AJ55_9PEZI|nr:Alpha/Beta hydrolase protein [Podospora australis]
MFDSNPNPIQDGPPNRQPNNPWAKRPVPLVLIHDGGGTVFSYYCLGDLARPVWGIANPRYDSGEPWTGGIPEMATAYLRFIRQAVPRGKIILGGWSLGGLLSLEIANQISKNPITYPFDVTGIIMIDSVCPRMLTQPAAAPVVQHVLTWGVNTREETKEKVMRCFAHAGKMVKEWKLPEWEDTHIKNRPPPVILLRATDAVPIPEGETGMSRVDVHRHDRLLGWGGYRRDLITKVVDIPGHHFNIFNEQSNLDVATEEIRKACLDLETKFGAISTAPRRLLP